MEEVECKGCKYENSMDIQIHLWKCTYCKIAYRSKEDRQIHKDLYVNQDLGKECSVKYFDYVTYHTCFPLQITETIDEYCYHPKNLFVKHLCYIFKPLRRYLDKKNKDHKTFKRLCDCNTFISGGNQDVILAMANSGDYSLSEALMLYSQSCERCTNVLAYKYLDGKDGYAEYSDDWEKCNTVCDFCRKE